MDVKFKTAMVLVMGTLLGFSCAGVAADESSAVYTASIDSRGKVLAQVPTWIERVESSPKPGYFTDYKVLVRAGTFKRAPGFCAVSVTDVDSLDDVFYAQAKLSGTPTTRHVKVVTHQIGSSEPAASSAKSFMLVCFR